jgi:LacI family transcriptional regulator
LNVKLFIDIKQQKSYWHFDSPLGEVKVEGSMETKKQPTLASVAEAAGVGVMTVSRTINGYPHVSPETAKKVHAAIKALGYRPNQAARMLMGMPSNSIGLVLPDLADHFFSNVAHAVQEAARAAGYLVLMVASNSEAKIERLEIERLLNHKVDGIVLVPSDSNNEELSELIDNVPIVSLDQPLHIQNRPIDSVEVENREGARIAVEHLIAHGRKRIACIGYNSHLKSIKDRAAGYEDAMRKAVLPSLVDLQLTSATKTKQFLTDFLKRKTKADALFTTNNVATVRLLEICREMQIQIPEQVALIGFDDFDLSSVVVPPLTVLRQPAFELGQHAVRLLLNQIDTKIISSPVKTVLPVELVIRQSCGCVG